MAKDDLKNKKLLRTINMAYRTEIIYWATLCENQKTLENNLEMPALRASRMDPNAHMAVPNRIRAVLNLSGKTISNNGEFVSVVGPFRTLR